MRFECFHQTFSSYSLRVRDMLICLVLMTASCVSKTEPAPFSPPVDLKSLLINQADLPISWKISDIYTSKYNGITLCTDACAFLEAQPDGMKHYILQNNIYAFRTSQAARDMYDNLHLSIDAKDIVMNSGFHTERANQSDDQCYKGTHDPYAHCVWIAQYGPYLVELYSAMDPVGLTMSEYKQVLVQVDAKMKAVVQP